MDRISKDFYYLKLAQVASERSTCLSKHYGAVIVKNDTVIATGYNGAPRGRINCCERQTCYRLEMKTQRGTNYASECRSVHAEQNAIIAASRDQMIGSTMYVYGWNCVTKQVVENCDSCPVCKRLIINAGIERVVFSDMNIGIGSDFADYRAKLVKVEDWITNDDSLSLLGGY